MVLGAIDQALAVEKFQRLQSSDEWIASLRGSRGTQEKTVLPPPKKMKLPDSLSIRDKKIDPVPWIVVGAVVLILFVFLQNFSIEDRAKAVTAENPVLTQKAEEGDDAETQDMAREANKNEAPTFVGHHPGEERYFEIIPGVKMTFCWCPPGKFTMGSPAGELGRESDENQVEVTLSRGFWLAKTEVTQGQWKAAGGIDVSGRPPSFWNGKVQAAWEKFSASGILPVNFKGDKLPVERVDWNESQDWCSGLTERLRNDGKLGKGLKSVLPTEAQWEYACRAGTTTALHSGRNLTSKKGVCPNFGVVGWYDQNSENRIQPVGEKKANAWGLHDMHGNVHEWCADWPGEELAGGIDPQGAATGVHRAARGGSWSCAAARCRASDRGWLRANFRDFNFGFRPALVPSE